MLIGWKIILTLLLLLLLLSSQCEASRKIKLKELTNGCLDKLLIEVQLPDARQRLGLTLSTDSVVSDNLVLSGDDAGDNDDGNVTIPCLYQGINLYTGETVAAAVVGDLISTTFYHNNNWYEIHQSNIKNQPITAQQVTEKIEGDFAAVNFANDTAAQTASLNFTTDKQQSRQRRSASLANLIFDEEPEMIMEVAVVCDISFIQKWGRHKVIERIMEIINYANDAYRKLGLKLVLVHLELWSYDKFDVPNDSNSLLLMFCEYKMRYINTYHDVAIFITNKEFERNVVGRAYENRLCHSSYSSAVISTFKSPSNQPVIDGITVAHEIGHVIGFQHVGASCNCTHRQCIMGAKLTMSNVHQTIRVGEWSLCTINVWKNGQGSRSRWCLKTSPSLSKQQHALKNSSATHAICGNGVVENNEECDCGPVKKCPVPHCCNPNTCRLEPNAQCSSGACCDKQKCRFYPRGHICRRKRGFCDLAEICDGVSDLCPADDALADGVECKKNEAYCYDGECATANQHCQLITNGKALSAPDHCYKYFNTMGRDFGYCHRWRIPQSDSIQYSPCKSDDAKCGAVQCKVNNGTDLHEFGFKTCLFKNQLNQWKLHHCTYFNIDYLSASKRDIMRTPDGVACGHGRMCINSTCQPISLKTCNCTDFSISYLTRNGRCNCKNYDNLIAKTIQREPTVLLSISFLTPCLMMLVQLFGT